MAERLGIVFGFTGAALTVLLFAFFTKLAFDGQLTWAFWPTLIFVLFCFVPYVAGRMLKFIFTGR
jgi:hypothetical protein